MRASWLTNEMTAAGLTDLQRHSAGHTFYPRDAMLARIARYYTPEGKALWFQAARIPDSPKWSTITK